MKTRLSSLDIYFLVKELSSLVGARIDKVYQIGEREIKISLRDSGRKDMIITPEHVCVTRFEHRVPKKPSNMSMLLRKHLGGGVVKSVRQHRFDRIIKIGVDGRGTLILELFSRGNIILADEKGTIISIMESQEWKDRELRPGLPYSHPPEMPDVGGMSPSQFSAALAKGREVVKTLASDLGLGATYANEALKRAGIDPDSRADKESAKRLYSAVQEMLESDIEAGIVLDGGPEDVVPFPLEIYSDRKTERKPSFNEAVDEYFSNLRAKGMKMEATKDHRSEIKRLEKIVEKQKETVGEMKAKAGEFKRAGDRIYEKYGEIQKTLGDFKSAKRRKGMNWREFARHSGVRVLDPKSKKVEIDGLGIFIGKTVPENAAKYYKKAKKAKGKLKGARKALKESERELGEARSKKVKVEKRAGGRAVEKPKPEWYEKFRWFRSSDGLLVIGGRDAATNELLIKKHLGKDDLVFHSTVHGAPFFIVKNPEGKRIPKNTREEAAEAAASYSKAWNAGWGSADVYAVGPEQVSKTPESGEYLPKGAFVIRGEREWFKGVALKLAIGFRTGGRALAVGGPERAIKKQVGHYVRIGVGNKKSGQLAKEIKKGILRKTNKEEGRRIKKVDLGDIQKWIPAGKGMILK